MRNYAKVGGKIGKPGYRTPSGFRYRKYLKTQKKKRKTKRVDVKRGV